MDLQETGAYVSTSTIISAIDDTIGTDLTEQYLRANVVGPLRDEGVLVVSGPNGYKLADRSDDLPKFVGEVDRRVVPQLKRLAIMRSAVVTSTLGEVDILSCGFEHLSDAIDAVSGST